MLPSKRIIFIGTDIAIAPQATASATVTVLNIAEKAPFFAMFPTYTPMNIPTRPYATELIFASENIALHINPAAAPYKGPRAYAAKNVP